MDRNQNGEDINTNIDEDTTEHKRDVMMNVPTAGPGLARFLELHTRTRPSRYSASIRTDLSLGVV